MPRPISLASFGTEMQSRTRTERKFAQTEADLTILVRQTAPSLLDLLDPTMARQKLSELLSYLGSYNPRPAPVEEDDTLWLLDNVAFRGPVGSWQAEFLAATFAQHPSVQIMDVVSHLADIIGLSDSERDISTLKKRILPFVMDIRPGKVVNVSFGGSDRLKLGPGGRNGISRDTRALPPSRSDTIVAATAEVPEGVSGRLEMKTLYTDFEGWAVISDIDDTIKITQTSDPIGILRTTFVSEPTPVAGMPELYTYLLENLDEGSPFLYLSASPYNLYPFLHDFRDQFYPFGPLILRDSSWMTIPGLLANLTVGTEEYKVDRMKKVRSWLPRKKLICIGDSTQSDPEAYGTIYRKFPGWVRLILIRKVTDIAALGLAEKNGAERFDKAFEGVAKSAWHVFEDPAECYELVRNTLS